MNRRSENQGPGTREGPGTKDAGRTENQGPSTSDDTREYPPRPIVGVGAVILDSQRVLLARRGHAPLEGHWSLPGGMVELGEHLEAALVREVFEETGLRVDVGPVVKVLDRIERTADDRVTYHYVIIDYLCRSRGGQPARGSDAAEVCWADLADLAQYGLTEAATAVILKAVRMSGLDASRESTPAPRPAR